MNNTKIIEEKYGKPMVEWEADDFNAIGVSDELSELLNVETCIENANNEAIPEATRNIFLTYVIADKFTSAIEHIMKLIEDSKEKKVDDIKTLSDLMNVFKNGDTDYLKAHALLMLLLAENYLKDDEKMNLNQYEEDIKTIIESIIEDLEFIGVKKFLSLAEQYIEFIYNLASAYVTLYEVDLISKYFNDRVNNIVDEYTSFKNEFIEKLMSNPEMQEMIKSLDPELFDKFINGETE